jgi:hypothetical protein
MPTAASTLVEASHGDRLADDIGDRRCVGMVVQRAAPLLLHLLATDGYITRTEQQHGAMTWHLLDPAGMLLRGRSGCLAAASTATTTSWTSRRQLPRAYSRAATVYE